MAENHPPLNKHFKKTMALLQVILYEAFCRTGQERGVFTDASYEENIVWGE